MNISNRIIRQSYRRNLLTILLHLHSSIGDFIPCFCVTNLHLALNNAANLLALQGNLCGFSAKKLLTQSVKIAANWNPTWNVRCPRLSSRERQLWAVQERRVPSWPVAQLTNSTYRWLRSMLASRLCVLCVVCVSVQQDIFWHLHGINQKRRRPLSCYVPHVATHPPLCKVSWRLLASFSGAI